MGGRKGREARARCSICPCCPSRFHSNRRDGRSRGSKLWREPSSERGSGTAERNRGDGPHPELIRGLVETVSLLMCRKRASRTPFSSCLPPSETSPRTCSLSGGEWRCSKLIRRAILHRSWRHCSGVCQISLRPRRRQGGVRGPLPQSVLAHRPPRPAAEKRWKGCAGCGRT